MPSLGLLQSLCPYLNRVCRGDTDDAPFVEGEGEKVCSSILSRAEADIVVEGECRWTGLAAMNNVDSYSLTVKDVTR